MRVQVIALALATAAGSGLAAAQRPAATMAAVPAGMQVTGCLHRENENTQQRDRRLEAIRAARLIVGVVAARIPPKADMTWEEVENVPQVQFLKNQGGPDGDLARKIVWGHPELLPGWRISNFVKPAFTMTDVWDACRYTLSSTDDEIAPKHKVVPLDAS